MKRFSMKVELVEAVNALLGGVVQDNSPAGTLVAGYMIRLSGTSAKAADIDPIADCGQLIINSAVAGNLVTEQNFGFIAERTRAGRGSTRYIQPVIIGDPIEIDFFHDFDISGDFSHGNVYVMGPGDSMQIVLPAMDAADVQAGTVWEVHRLVPDRGEALYLPRYQGRGIDLAEIRQTLQGFTASVMMQRASVTAPTRISLFDAFQRRLVFLPWNAALAYTNAMWSYDADEAEAWYYALYSEDPSSVLKCFGNDKCYLETIGGVGTAEISHCTVDQMPSKARELASEVSASSLRTEISKAGRAGLAKESASALIGQSKTSAPITPQTEYAAVPAMAVQSSAKV